MASPVAGDDPGLFKVAVRTPPARLGAEDGARVKIPIIYYLHPATSPQRV
ncbi:hypothetical protein ANO14919_005810 [Xylariales sp. No.14919]|nr:hypothetical protein ANO14919_005810 [Xylariales sp. No.14919]